MKKIILFLFATLLSSISAFSQVTPSSGISGSGTSNTIAKFTGAKKVGNSVISQNAYGKVTVNDSLLINGSTSYSTSTQAITSRENLLVKEVYTTSDATTTSSVAASVSALTFTPTINKMYKVDGAIRIGCNNTGGIKLALSVPTGATFSLSFSGSLSSNDTYRTAFVSSSGSLSSALNTFNGSNYTRVSGFIWMSSTSGTITLSIASTTSGQTSTLYSGSWITFTQLD